MSLRVDFTSKVAGRTDESKLRGRLPGLSIPIHGLRLESKDNSDQILFLGANAAKWKGPCLPEFVCALPHKSHRREHWDTPRAQTPAGRERTGVQGCRRVVRHFLCRSTASHTL